MNARNFHLHDSRGGAAFTVRVTPRASRNEITEIMPDGTIKIHLTASSDQKECNQALIHFLSDVLGVEGTQIEIIGGVSEKDKLLSVLDMDTQEAHQRILAYLE